MLSAVADPDFSASTTDATVPLWVFIAIGVVLIGASIVGVKIFEDIVVVLPILAIGSVVAYMALVIFYYNPIISNFPDSKKFQSWVQDKYLIDITEEQSQYLLENQVDLAESPYSYNAVRPVFVENAYGDIVSLTLVKKDNEWTLVQQADTSETITIEDK